jgi:hypothetical protein
MDTYVGRGDRRGKPARLRLISGPEALPKVRHSEPASRETDDRVSLRVALAAAVLPSIALWALIWFALTRLISNWP